MNASGTDVDELVSRACHWVFDKTGSRVTGEMDLLEAGVLDSTAFVELVSHIEGMAELQIDLLEIAPEDFATIQGLCRSALKQGSPG